MSPEAKNLTSFYLYRGVFEVLVGLHIGLFANSFTKSKCTGFASGIYIEVLFSRWPQDFLARNNAAVDLAIRPSNVRCIFKGAAACCFLCKHVGRQSISFSLFLVSFRRVSLWELQQGKHSTLKLFQFNVCIKMHSIPRFPKLFTIFFSVKFY